MGIKTKAKKEKKLPLRKAKKRLADMMERQSIKFDIRRQAQIQEAFLEISKRIVSGEVEIPPPVKKFGRHIAEMYGGPQIGEVWEHEDGGSFYILSRTRKSVRYQRRPWGDLMAEPDWISMNTFNRTNRGRLKEAVITAPLCAEGEDDA